MPLRANEPHLTSTSPLGEARVLFSSRPEGSAPHPEIVLVRPNVIDPITCHSGMFRESLGILVLSSHLEANGVACGVLEATLFQCSREETADLAVAHSPRWGGIYAFSTQALGGSLELAAAIRSRRPDVRIVLGGHGVTFVAREVLERNPDVDAVIRNEGEGPLLRLLTAPDESAWDSVPNLSYRRGGEVVENPAVSLPRDLDGSPLPSRFVRDLMESDPVHSRTPLMVFTSKGCYDNCAYCTVHEFYGGWRGRSARHVADEIEALLRRFSWRTVHFWDDQFAGPGRNGRRRAIELADELTRRNLDIVFHVTIRPSDLTEEVVRELARAGLRSVFIGIESSDQRLLDGFFGKHIRTSQSREAIDLLWKYGVHRIIVGFMLFHPEMTWDLFRRDLDFLDTFPNLGHECLTSRTHYYPGSRLWGTVRDLLGPDAYKEVYVPPLLGEPFQRLFKAVNALSYRTMGIEMLFVCLEERHLHELDAIDFIAEHRVRLFRFLSARVRALADLLERGLDHREATARYCEEVLQESLRIIDVMERRMGGAHFDHLLLANRLLGYRNLRRDAGDFPYEALARPPEAH